MLERQRHQPHGRQFLVNRIDNYFCFGFRHFRPRFGGVSPTPHATFNK
jgi:hypothetical protein